MPHLGTVTVARPHRIVQQVGERELPRIHPAQLARGRLNRGRAVIRRKPQQAVVERRVTGDGACLDVRHEAGRQLGAAGARPAHRSEWTGRAHILTLHQNRAVWRARAPCAGMGFAHLRVVRARFDRRHGQVAEVTLDRRMVLRYHHHIRSLYSLQSSQSSKNRALFVRWVKTVYIKPRSFALRMR